MSKNTNLSFLTDYITADITNGRIGINNASPTVAFDVVGATKITGVLTLTSTISNGTYAYTLPSATGTLALTSALSGTTNYLAKFTSSTAIGNSAITDDGTTVTLVSRALTGTTATFRVSDNRNLAIKYDTNITLSGQADSGAPENLRIYADTFKIFTSTTTVGLTERLTVSNNGNVGIGNTTMPTATSGFDALILGKSTSSSTALVFTNGGSTVWGFSYASVSKITLSSYADLAFETGVSASERMRITSAGNVGIGTTTPSQKLEVIGTAKLSSAEGNVVGINIIPGSQTNIYQTIGNGASGARFHASIETGWANYENTGSSQMLFKTETKGGSGTSDTSVVQMVIRPTGDIRMTSLVGSGSRTVVADANGQLSASVSDVTLKENIIPIGYGLKEIMQMNPVWFDFVDGYKNYGEGRQNGNIAQEIAEIIPEAVFTTPQTGKMGINYEQLHAVYIKAIQELKTEIETLKNK